MIKKIIIIFILLYLPLFSFGTTTTSTATGTEGRPLEITYPVIPGQPSPLTTATSFSSYVIYVFSFIIAFSGIIALFSIVLGGFRYLSSAGSPEETNKARNQVISAFIGLIILFGSFIILNTINPNFTLFSDSFLPQLPSSLKIDPGIILCTREIDQSIFNSSSTSSPSSFAEFFEYCSYLTGPGRITKNITRIYSVANDNQTEAYGSIFYNSYTPKDSSRAQIIYHNLASTLSTTTPMTWVRYATPFALIKDYSIPRKVKLYRYRDMDKNPDNPPPLEFELSASSSPSSPSVRIIDLKNNPWPASATGTISASGSPLEIGSIEIEPSGTKVIFVKELDLTWTSGRTIWPISYSWPAFIGVSVSKWCRKGTGNTIILDTGTSGNNISCASWMIIIPQKTVWD